MPRVIGRDAVPHLLLEGESTNLCLRSDEFDHATWTKTAAGAGSVPVVTANAGTAPDGSLTADAVVFQAPGSGDRSSLSQSIATTATNSYAGSLWVRAATAADVGKVLLFRHVAGSTYLGITLSASWQRVQVAEVAAGASSSFAIDLRPGFSGSSTGTVTAHLWRAQLEAGSSATSEIKTEGTAQTRGAESLYHPLRLLPRGLTAFISGRERQAPPPTGTTGLLHIGAAGNSTDPRLGLYKNSPAGYAMQHDNAVTPTNSTPLVGAAVAVDDEVDVRGVLGDDGSTLTAVSLNGGAEETTAPSTAQALASAWAGERIYFNSWGTGNVGCFALRASAIADGTLTRDELRDLCEVG